MDEVMCVFCRDVVAQGAVRMRTDCTGDVAPVCLTCWPGPVRRPARCQARDAATIERVIQAHVAPEWQEAARAFWGVG